MATALQQDLAPVYFLSHGGPTLLDETKFPYDEPIGKGLKEIGDDILAYKPKGVVIISGHWEAGSNYLQVNGKDGKVQPLIYDFYNFPSWYYKEQFEHQVDERLTQQVADLVSSAGIDIESVDRGLDHGVWVALKKAGLENAGFPIVQLSLYQNESAEDHIRLGEILQPLREQGIVIVGSGMAVHNLRDMWGSDEVRPYVKPFDREVENAVVNVSSGDERKKQVADLLHSRFLRQAHPTLEHLLPLHVAVGAAGDSKKVTKLSEQYDVSLSWSSYKLE
ncbi:hypothetical protein GGI12_005104 [Dipsacomyces acuminosporus]|nr:hypothetical protein GGI12_005104 [Dipsacomyces acuminosporus]